MPVRSVNRTAAESGVLRDAWRGRDGRWWQRTDQKVDRDVDGFLAWLWRGSPGQDAAIEIEALAGHSRRLIRVSPGRGVKRAVLPGLRVAGRVFVAQAQKPEDPVSDLHVCEGAPDAMCVANFIAGPGDGVVGAHGAAALGRLAVDAPWLIDARSWRRVHIWADGDQVGEDAADQLAGDLDRRGLEITIHYGVGDLAERGESRRQAETAVVT